MVVQVGSGNVATVEEYFFEPMEEGPVQVVALICLETVLKTIDSVVHFLLAKELAITALDILLKAGLASKLVVAKNQYSSSEVYMQALNFRSATHIDKGLLEDSNMNNETSLDDEIHRPCDGCKASVNYIPLEGLVQDPEVMWKGDISAWIVGAAKGRDEVNSNHASTDKSRVGGKKEPQDHDEYEDDDEDDDDIESGDEGNDDGEEGEEDGNEDDEDDEEDEEEEEEDDEDEEELAPASASRNVRAQNAQVEVEDDSDEGDEEEEGVEDEDDFEDGEDEDGEGDEEEEEEEEEEEDEEDIPEPPKKKKKSA